MKIMFKRVGADTGAGAGKRLSPIFPGGFFHFVTIPSHYDPELFYKFTYGDRLRDLSSKTPNPTATPLQKLRKGDVLVFYGGFQATKPPYQKSIGVFAYIVVQRAYVINHKTKVAWEFSEAPEGEQLDGNQTRKAYNLCMDAFEDSNPHTERRSKSELHILICGDLSTSTMLSKVQRLAVIKDGQYRLDQPTAAKWGLKPGSSFTRNMPRWVSEDAVDKVWRQLKRLA